MRAPFQPVPPKIKSPAATLKFFAVAILAATVLGVGAIVFFFNPGTHGFYPVCLFHQLTGLNCPGCGSTRALYALLHGQFLTALRDNALFVATLAAAGIWCARLVFQKRWKEKIEFSLPPKFLWTFLAVAIVFTVLRNLPAFSFLSP